MNSVSRVQHTDIHKGVYECRINESAANDGKTTLDEGIHEHHSLKFKKPFLT